MEGRRERIPVKPRITCPVYYRVTYERPKRTERTSFINWKPGRQARKSDGGMVLWDEKSSLNLFGIRIKVGYATVVTVTVPVVHPLSRISKDLETVIVCIRITGS